MLVPLRISDLALVLETVLPEPEATPERMLTVIADLRGKGRVLTLHTTEAAFQALARSVGASTAELEQAFLQAPDGDREAIKRAFSNPDHQGCHHLRDQLARSPFASALLEAFITASWYGWPGLDLRIATYTFGNCCCGTELGTSRPLRPSELRAMDAADI